MSDSATIKNTSTNDTELLDFLFAKCQSVIITINADAAKGSKNEKIAYRAFQLGQRQTCQHVIDDINNGRANFQRNMQELV